MPWQHHDDNVDSQRHAIEHLFAAVDPVAEVNIRAHRQLLANLCASQPELLRD